MEFEKNNAQESDEQKDVVAPTNENVASQETTPENVPEETVEETTEEVNASIDQEDLPVAAASEEVDA